MDPVPLRLVCIEPRFPGRLGAVADWLVRRRGYQCQFFCHSADDVALWPTSAGHGLEVVPFAVGGVAAEPQAEWTRLLERGLCYAYGCWEVLSNRKMAPIDLVLGRSAGLGSTLFTSLNQPGVPIVNFFDYYLAVETGDLADEDVSTMPAAYRFWRRSTNAMDLLDLENGVYPWVPTRWQRDTYPVEYRDDFVVLSDGIDTRRFGRASHRPQAVGGRPLAPDTKVISFVADSTDRRHGFDRFIQLMNRLVRAGEDVLGVVLGDPIARDRLDIRFYNQNYRSIVLEQDPPPDSERLVFLDKVSAAQVAEVLAISDLHVYPNRASPISRSLLEAMAAGCIVLAADTAPVREVLNPNVNGYVACGTDLLAWESQARALLNGDRSRHRAVSAAAQEHIRRHYAQDVTLPKLAEYLDLLARMGRAGPRVGAWRGQGRADSAVRPSLKIKTSLEKTQRTLV